MNILNSTPLRIHITKDGDLTHLHFVQTVKVTDDTRTDDIFKVTICSDDARLMSKGLAESHTSFDLIINASALVP